eukprot:g1921.t1
MPASTDSFVFSMLRQHCEYVSPELEQAYLDPFVMMLTACAVPVLIRIADILMAAIGAGTAAASKRIKRGCPSKQKCAEEKGNGTPAASAAMGGASDRVGATMDGGDGSAPATGAGDTDGDRVSAGAEEQEATGEHWQDEPEEEAQETQEVPHTAEDAEDREAREHREQHSDDGDETKADCDHLEASSIEIVVASSGDSAQAQAPASRVTFELTDEVAKSNEQPRLYRIKMTVGTHDSLFVDLRYSVLRALYTPELRQQCGSLNFPPKIRGMHSREALADRKAALAKIVRQMGECFDNLEGELKSRIEATLGLKNLVSNEACSGATKAMESVGQRAVEQVAGARDDATATTASNEEGEEDQSKNEDNAVGAHEDEIEHGNEPRNERENNAEGERESKNAGEDGDEDDDEDDGEERPELRAFFLLLQLGCTVYAAASYFNARRLVRGPAYPCNVVFGVVAPMYKPLAFPMWSALMPIASFAYWLRHRHIEPRHVVGVPAGAPPLARNWLTWLALIVQALLLCVWLGFCAALLPLVVVFLPVTLALLAAPVVLVALPRYLLAGSVQRWRTLQLMWWAVRIVCGAAGLPCEFVASVLYALAYGMCCALHTAVVRCSKAMSKDDANDAPEFGADFRNPDELVHWVRKHVWSWPFVVMLALVAAPCVIFAFGCAAIATDKIGLRDKLAERINAAAAVRAAHRLSSSASLGEEDQGLLLLKVAAAVLVCTMVSMGSFAGYYTGAATETWSDLANAVLARLPAFDFSFRVAFAWPSRLVWDVQVVLGVAIGAFSVRYLLLAFRKAWTLGGLETWGEDVFAVDPKMWGKGAPIGTKDSKNNQQRFPSALAARIAEVAAAGLCCVLLFTAAALEWGLRHYTRFRSPQGTEDTAEQTTDASVRGYVRSYAASGGKNLMLNLHQCVQVTPRALSNLTTRERNSVRELDLSDMRMDVVQATAWAHRVKQHLSLTTVHGLTGATHADFSNKGWGVADAILVSIELEVNSALTSVNLFKNNLGDGAAAVVAAAKQQGNIKTLCGIKEGQEEADLAWKGSGPRLNAADAVLLSFDLHLNRALTSVNLLYNDIGDGAVAIVAAAKQGGNIKTLCGIKECQTSLNLKNAGLRAPDAVLLSFDLELNRALTSANLLNNDLGDGAAAIVAAAKQGNNINTLCGIEEGKTEVSFSGERLNAPDAVLLSFDLEFNRSLISASLGNREQSALHFSRSNNIGDEGAIAISTALESNATLTHIDLEGYESGAKIGLTGAQAISKMLAVNMALTSINLLKNDLCADGLAHIATAWEQSSTLKSICGIAAGVTTANLSQQRLGAADARMVALELRFNRALISADFSGNFIGDEGTAALSEALKTNSTLDKLDLGSNDIGATGAQSLAGMLQVNRALNTLGLSQNNIGVYEYVKKDQLQGTSFKEGDTVQYNGQQFTISMDENSHGDLKVQNISGVIALAEALKVNRALKNVDLSSNKLGTEGIRALCSALKTNSSVESLALQNAYPCDTQINAEGAQLIADMLAVNRSLNTIDLSQNNVGGVSCVKQGQLQGTSFNKGDTVQHNGQRCIVVWEKGYSDYIGVQNLSGVYALAGALKFNRALTSINLLQNDLGDGAAAVVAAAKQNSSIKTLCGINEDETKISLDSFDFFTNALGGDVQTRLKAPGAVLLSFDFEINRTLVSATLGGNDIGDEGAAALSGALKNNSTLQTLELWRNEIGDAGAQSLAEMLQVNRALKSANFSANSIGDGGTAALSEALKTNTTLEALELRGTDVGTAGAQSLADMLKVNRALTSVNLLNNDLGDGAVAIVAAAKQNGNIKTLCGINEGKPEVNLRRQGLGAADAVLLSFDLEFNRALITVDLGNNKICGQYVKEAEATGTTFKVGDVVQWKGTEGTISKEKDSDGEILVYFQHGIQAIAEALKINRSLTSLNLKDNENGAGGAKAIAHALQQSALRFLTINVELDIEQLKTSTSIDLSSKGLRYEEAIIVAKCIEFNTSLKSADFGCNDMGEKGTVALSEALKSNSTLEELKLVENKIGVAGAQSLATMLQFNRSLTSLDLSDNEIGAGGAKAIAGTFLQSPLKSLTINVELNIEELKSNTSLDLRDKGLCVEEAIIVAKCMEFNAVLNSVDLRNNRIPDQGKQQLRDAVGNKSITLQL